MEQQEQPGAQGSLWEVSTVGLQLERAWERGTAWKSTWAGNGRFWGKSQSTGKCFLGRVRKLTRDTKGQLREAKSCLFLEEENQGGRERPRAGCGEALEPRLDHP